LKDMRIEKACLHRLFYYLTGLGLFSQYYRFKPSQSISIYTFLLFNLTFDFTPTYSLVR
jgi:hypothetical protein